MTTYELMVLVAPSVDLTSEKAQEDMIKKIVADSGTIKDVTSLGKKIMAYPIAKQKEATYLLAILEGTVKAGDIESKVKLMDEVLRYLLTVKN